MSEVLKKKMINRMNGSERQTPKDRVSTINNSFVQGVIPHALSSEDEIEKFLKCFPETNGKWNCIYCGTNEATTIDHLHSLVEDGLPSGYYDEINNFVPSCGTCNSSKSGSHWKEWLDGQKIKTGDKKKVAKPDEAIIRVEKFLAVFTPSQVSFPGIANDAGVGDVYKNYIEIQKKIASLMEEADNLGTEICKEINKYLKEKNK